LSYFSNIMARHFKEEDIDEFRECFSLYARGGQVRSVEQLALVMRSLGCSATLPEVAQYFRLKGGSLSFPDFLDVLHRHGGRGDAAKEVLAAFRASDPSGSGLVPAASLRHTLLHWGERLTPREVEQIFREVKVNPRGQVRYADFVKMVCAPVPDYS